MVRTNRLAAELEAEASFGEHLRHFRRRAGLTQEALAELARVSARTISDLERGTKQHPHRTTIALLAGALDLSPDERALLEGTTRRSRGPVRLTGERPTSLPEPPTSLVGRRRDIEEAVHRLRWGGVRLLTLTGPGGVGKTRLAIAVAHALRASCPTSPVCVSLAPLRNADLVGSAIATTLGIRETRGRSDEDLLVGHLQKRQTILVLDNFEHVVEAAPLLARLLHACPQLTLVVTSRTALRIQGEHRMEISPLEVPAEGALAHLDTAAHYPAIELFVQRAAAARRDFVLTDANLPAVVEICRRLDGLPLAIELAAARMAHLSPQAVLMRLSRRLRVLTDGPTDAPERHRTLWDTIAWSYDLLREPEQRLFRQVAVFAGSWELEAVEAVCGDTETSPVFERLSALIDRSLILLDDGAAAEPRYRMLETVHEYAAEQLSSSGESQVLRDRHLAHYVKLTEEAEPHLTGSEQASWIIRLEAERDNLLAALQWAEERHLVADGLRILINSRLLWEQHGPLGETRRWVERFLSSEHNAASPVDHQLRFRALGMLGRLCAMQGEVERAERLYQEALALVSGTDDSAAIAQILNVLAGLAHDTGNTNRAMELYHQALSAATAAGDTWHMAAVYTNLGNLVMDLGELDQATVWLLRGLDLLRELGEKRVMGMNLNVLGEIYRMQGMPDRARETFREALRLLHEVTDLMNLAYSLDCLARLARDDGAMVWAVQLMGASGRLRATLGASSDPDAQAVAGQVLADCNRALGAARVAAALEEGANMALEEVVAHSLDEHVPPARLFSDQDVAPAT